MTKRDRIFNELLAAAQKVLAGLNARIDEAPSTAKPVFDGIVELHDAVNRAPAAPRGPGGAHDAA